MLKMCKIAEKKTFSSDQNVIHPMDSAKKFSEFSPFVTSQKSKQLFFTLFRMGVKKHLQVDLSHQVN